MEGWGGTRKKQNKSIPKKNEIKKKISRKGGNDKKWEYYKTSETNYQH